MRALLPGSTIGILGGGQLGRMITYEAHRMGYRVVALDKRGAPCDGIADEFVEGAFNSLEGALEVAKRADVVTVETEHIPWEILAQVEKQVPLRPHSGILKIIQNRRRQKQFLAESGFPQPKFHPVEDEESLADAVEAVGVPSLLKTQTGGYDGKGQARLKSVEDAPRAWLGIDQRDAVLEAFVQFEKEISVVLARSVNDEIECFPVAENVHREGILHTTRMPASVDPAVSERAREIAAGIARALDHVGVMAVEMFVLPDGELLVNEIAPRVHNSGHYTLGACITSQFEQHLRAIAGLKLGTPCATTPAVMLNLLGDLWTAGEPDWRVVLDEPDTKLHLYGKKGARTGRKMGHLVVFNEDVEEALRVAERLHAILAEQAGLSPPE